jgi:hypothetical protein
MEINVEFQGNQSHYKLKYIKKSVENVEEFNCLGSMITNDARCTQEIKARIVMAKAAFNKKTTLLTSKLN